MKQAHFLVIDDEPYFNQTLCRALTRKGQIAFSALNSQSALALVAEKPLDYIVLDLNLGTEQGIDLIKPLLAQKPRLLIVVLTGYANLTTAVQAIKLGAWNYLAKPIDTDSILRAFDIQYQSETKNEPLSLKQLEWEHLQRVLADNQGNITTTARQLGMYRRTLQRKLQKKNNFPEIKE